MKGKRRPFLVISLVVLLAILILGCVPARAPAPPLAPAPALEPALPEEQIMPPYSYWYSVMEICGYQFDRSHYLEFELVKDEQLQGKLVVEPEWAGGVVFYVTDDYGRHVRDAGRVGEGEDYSFSIKAEQSGVRYRCWFNYSLLAYASSAIFYCNVPADDASSGCALTHQIPHSAHAN